MTKTPAAHVQPLDALRRDLLARRAQNNPPTPWRALAADYPGVPAGTLCAISKGREPRKACVRRALGLPVLVAVPACPTCGGAHKFRPCRPALPAHITTCVEFLAAREPRPMRTNLGSRLLEIRQRIVASGEPLLDRAALARELSERRGAVYGRGGRRVG